MKYRIYLLLLMTIAIFSCSAPQEEISDTVTINGKITNAADDDLVSIWAVKMLGDNEKLGETTLNTEGIFEFVAEIDEPVEAMLRIGRESSSMYLTPGDELTVTLDAEQLDESITYEGTGADANNYLAKKYLVEEAFNESLDIDNIYKLEQEEFVAACNALKSELESNLKEATQNADLPEALVSAEKASMIADWANSMENFETYHGYYTGNREFEVDESFFSFREKLDLNDPTALKSAAFRSYLDGWTSRQISDMMESNSELEDDWAAAYGEAYELLKSNEEVKGDVKQYVMANHLQNFMSYFGTDGVEAWLDDFKGNYPESAYSGTLDGTYTKWAKIAKGQPAPDFKYMSIDGEEVAFSDFRGKAVYIDVWATWCGPCKAEMPSAKELKKKFAENEDVVFLYVSVDDDKEKWEEFLANDPEFKGVHLITGSGWKSDITDAYMINGIPRYILVDKEGLIVTSSAPRPSSGEKIENMIRELLVEEDAG